jgi:hypothetical protein
MSCIWRFDVSDNTSEHQFILGDLERDLNAEIGKCRLLSEGCRTPGPKTLFGLAPIDTTGFKVAGNATPAAFCEPKFELCQLEVKVFHGEPFVIREIRENCSEVSVPSDWWYWTKLSHSDRDFLSKHNIGLLAVGGIASFPDGQPWPAGILTTQLFVGGMHQFYRKFAPIAIRYMFSMQQQSNSTGFAFVETDRLVGQAFLSYLMCGLLVPLWP